MNGQVVKGYDVGDSLYCFLLLFNLLFMFIKLIAYNGVADGHIKNDKMKSDLYAYLLIEQ